MLKSNLSKKHPVSQKLRKTMALKERIYNNLQLLYPDCKSIFTKIQELIAQNKT